MTENEKLPQIEKSRYERVKVPRSRIRINNLAVRLPILRADKKSHLPTLKSTGWHGSTPREYEYFDEVTIERTSQNVIFYLKQNIAYKIYKDNDVNKAMDLAQKILADHIFKFTQRYPGIELDFTKPRLVRNEIEVKANNLKKYIPKDMVMHDTIFKKVYRNQGIEFTGKAAPENAKKLINNMTINDYAPDFVDSFNKLSEQIELHLEATKEWKVAATEVREAMIPWYVKLWRRLRK